MYLNKVLMNGLDYVYNFFCGGGDLFFLSFICYICIIKEVIYWYLILNI